MGSYGQTTTKNYLKETTRRTASVGSFPVLGGTNAHVVTTTYYDGLGRPIQVVDQNSSPDDNKNIVTHIEYEKNIGQTKEFLPFLTTGHKTTTSGLPPRVSIITTYNSDYTDNAKAQTLAFYNTAKYENTPNPYSENRTEASPRKRVQEAGFPGYNWSLNFYEEYGITEDQRNTIRSSYGLNVSNEVKRFIVSTSFSDGIYKNNVSENGFYPENTLAKAVVKNENWRIDDGSNNTIEEFKDSKGNMILKRTYNKGEAHDTYYLYNDLDLLAFVLPPMANGEVLGDHLHKWCYQYNYDAKKRLVEKKLPQKDWEYIVYDKSDRVVMTGPVYNPFGDGSKGWLITKYDNFGRSIYTGYYAGSTFSSAERNSMAQNSITVESKSASNTTIDGITTRYTNTSFPTTFKLLSINYYDNYSFPNAPTSFPIIETQTVNTAVKGQLTGSWTRVLATAASTAGNLSYSFYDDKYRVIRSYSQNHLGGYTQVDSQLTFTGVPSKTVTYQKQNSSAAVLTITNNFTYDRRDRLISQTQQIGTGAIEKIVSNLYDELGVLVTKNVGGASGNLQAVDYKYNIRGWLTDINNADKYAPESEIKLYNQRIHYDQPPASISLSNGNISSVYTRTKVDNQLKGYRYTYDGLNRLTDAFGLTYTGSPQYMDGFVLFGDYNEKVSYDKNGNILTMNRTGELVNGQPIKIDELSYSYDGNQLQTVTDTTNNTDGFKDGNISGTDYFYDSFGNITQDLNKGITAVSYNHLNLPYQVTFSNGGTIKYTYDAIGTRLSKKVQPSGGALVTTDYVNGFQYVDNLLKFFPHSEGYVEFKNNQYLYTYQYKDHLGNVRLTYRDGFKNHATQENPKDGIIQVSEIIEKSDYYPFGLKQGGDDLPDYSTINKYKYAYGGKELNDELGLDLYDFGARNYDPALGRWLNIDPLAEVSRRWTPYNYAYNNPIYFVDPDGRLSGSFNNGYFNIDIVQFGGAMESWVGGFQTEGSSNSGRNEHDPPGGDPIRETVLPELVINTKQTPKSSFQKAWDAFVNIPSDFAESLHQEALAMVPGNSSGVDQSWFDAMSIGGSIGASGGIANFNFTLSLAATGDDVALVYGFDYGIGEFTKPGVGAGVTLNAHNLYGGSTDVLNELGGSDLTYSAGYVIKGSYGTSSTDIGNKTIHAAKGAKTYGVGFGYGGGVSKSNTSVYKLSNLRKDIPNGISRLKSTVLQAITPPKMF